MSRQGATRRSVIAAASAAVMIVLAGCVGLPTDSGVTTETIPAIDDASLLTLPASPQAGAPPQQILQGFVLAGRGPQEGYRVAREFLTDGFRTEWKPNAGVVISNSPIVPEPVPGDPDSFDVTITVLAEVSAAGNYTELSVPEPATFRYDLEQNPDGEWRIASAPDGTVLTQTRFNNTFNPYELTFFDASGAYLVPDLRWFPDTSTTKDRIVTELLDGPSAWLGSGVLVTAFPNGTKQVDPVVIDAGQATVDLSSEVRSQSGAAKQRMLQQLTASLGELDEVQSVRITVGGLPLAVPEGGQQPERVLTVGANPLGVADGQFGFLNGSRVVSVPEISSKVESLTPIGVTLGRGRSSAAVLSAAGAAFVLADAPEPIPVDIRQGLLTPTVDVEGYLWSITVDGSGGLIAFDEAGVPHPIPMALPEGARVVSIELARDSSRLLVALQTPDGPQLLAWGIVRDSSLVPIGLGAEPLVIPVGGAPILDATWVDGVTVAVLSQVDGSTAVDLHQIGGRAVPRGSITGGVGIAGGNTIDDIRVVDTAGVLFRPTGSRGWQSTSISVSLLATQQ